MTIDEAIKHCEEVVEEQDKLCKQYDDASRYAQSHNKDIVSANAKKCLECFECAKEHRQLAEWLKDYKRLKEQEPCCNCIEFKRYAKEMGFEIEQEPCEDVVSREFLLRDLLLKAQGERDVSIKWLEEYINSLPSVTPQEPKWIFCSERLPKVADCYAVTRKSGSDLMVGACYYDGINTWHNDNWINHERNYLTDIIAWMPLPKPYKPQESEEYNANIT